METQELLEEEKELSVEPELAKEVREAASEMTEVSKSEQNALTREEKLDAKRVVEAALFLANKPLAYAELALIAKTTVRKAREIAEKLSVEYSSREGAVELVCNAEEAVLQVKSEFLAPVAKLSKHVELTGKATRMLALIGKKGKILQSELKKYFRGDIYSYITELKQLGYVSSEKHGNTRLIRTTSKFYESFQLSKTE